MQRISLGEASGDLILLMGKIVLNAKYDKILMKTSKGKKYILSLPI